jgi:hypothetical protein
MVLSCNQLGFIIDSCTDCEVTITKEL